MDLGYRGKAIIVTGGSSNINRANVLAFAKEGANVVCADIDEKQRDGALRRGESIVTRGDIHHHVPACTQCHGYALTGALPAIPGLLGLPADYLIGQLGAWKTGNRHATAPDCMAEVAKRLSAEDVRAVAVWLASRPVPTGAKPAAQPDLPLPLECGSGVR